MSDTDKAVEMWKIKKLIKNLEAARGYELFVGVWMGALLRLGF